MATITLPQAPRTRVRLKWDRIATQAGLCLLSASLTGYALTALAGTPVQAPPRVETVTVVQSDPTCEKAYFEIASNMVHGVAIPRIENDANPELGYDEFEFANATIAYAELLSDTKEKCD